MQFFSCFFTLDVENVLPHFPHGATGPLAVKPGCFRVFVAAAVGGAAVGGVVVADVGVVVVEVATMTGWAFTPAKADVEPAT